MDQHDMPHPVDNTFNVLQKSADVIEVEATGPEAIQAQSTTAP